jgi:hypothetical protein
VISIKWLEALALSSMALLLARLFSTAATGSTLAQIPDVSPLSFRGAREQRTNPNAQLRIVESRRYDAGFRVQRHRIAPE